MMENKTDEFYLNLIKLGKKIEAVKVYSVENKCGLKEAKDYLDKLEGNNKADIIENINDSELIQLLKGGKKIKAIKLYRDSTNRSLKEAKNYVESLERTENIAPQKHSKTKFEGCFIATVCYGDYNTPEVVRFRKFRDDVLLKNEAGKYFVRYYYKLSPALSDLIGKSEILKSIIKKYFLNVILKIIK